MTDVGLLQSLHSKTSSRRCRLAVSFDSRRNADRPDDSIHLTLAREKTSQRSDGSRESKTDEKDGHMGLGDLSICPFLKILDGQMN